MGIFAGPGPWAIDRPFSTLPSPLPSMLLGAIGSVGVLMTAGFHATEAKTTEKYTFYYSYLT